MRAILVPALLCGLFGCHGRCGQPHEEAVDTAFEVSGDVWRMDVEATSNETEACNRACEAWAGSDTGRFDVSACESHPTTDTGDSGAVNVTCSAVGVYSRKCE